MMKKTIWIIAVVLLGVIALSIPSILWPDISILQAVAWPSLFVQWLLYYLLVGVEGLLWIVAVVNIFVGGYTRPGWARLVGLLIVGLVLLCIVRWVLITTGFVPFSDQPFVPVV
ncbi:MAG: hypothetical protein IKJ26_05770 [Clostridia bacterium]|nr:hypothetical protein [Clostridia bacterium]